jgi:CubicO group peptidase (beta-lactamase class C family)
MVVIDTRSEALCRHVDLDDMLAPLARKHRVPGAQLAVHHRGETIAVEFGELEVGAGTGARNRVAGSAAFPIGSVTKSFTATLLMILVADGDLSLDVPVGDYLPELADLGAEFTVRRVLSHTGGLAADPRSAAGETSSVRRYVADHCGPQNLLQRPGAGFSYSNIGYVLAGHLVEVSTGMSWWDAMESILLRPLGIDPVFIGTRPPSRRRIASGHSVNTAVGRIRPVQQSLARAEAPAGGLAVSATDLVRLGSLHLDPGMPGLLPAGCAELMRQPTPGAEPFGAADGWGLGLAVYRSGGAGWVGHDGNGNGTACYFRVNPVDGWAVALTSNSNTGYGLWQDLLGELSRTGIPIEPHRPRTSRRPMRAPLACAGTYVNGDVAYKVTVDADGSLDLVADDEPLGRVACNDDLSFLLRDAAAPEQEFYGRFRQDRFTGMIDGIQLGGRLARRSVHADRLSGRRLTA